MSTEIRALKDCPGFIRELASTQIGVSLEKINGWIDDGDEEGIELIKLAIFEFDRIIKEEQLLKSAHGGAL